MELADTTCDSRESARPINEALLRLLVARMQWFGTHASPKKVMRILGMTNAGLCSWACRWA
ncbi:hypothetical protein CHLRE_04g219925v5 [Chlamydomonas reinhardtii]|uniref:Uncharacterized protein n=1 Tax=Chlamydomonas reinhardtii TaxID=3055 RepID=A0A2K3DU63_CHLRE|nr:uncharacterized protein CHLRE_04g219925v5 [Chlamydomonas reinhardtii]PNW84071.1 hypothetical protein CHLRE_04g219925v5 [Chlamydomonas reinhardtii]